MSKLLVAPAKVEIDEVVTLAPVSVVSAPSVMAPAYDWLPLVVTLLPFKAMVLADTFTVVKLVAPTEPFKRTLPPLPLEEIFKLLEAAVSPEMVLAAETIALAAEAAKLVLAPKVMGPV